MLWTRGACRRTASRIGRMGTRGHRAGGHAMMSSFRQHYLDQVEGSFGLNSEPLSRLEGQLPEDCCQGYRARASHLSTARSIPIELDDRRAGAAAPGAAVAELLDIGKLRQQLARAFAKRAGAHAMNDGDF